MHKVTLSHFFELLMFVLFFLLIFENVSAQNYIIFQFIEWILGAFLLLYLLKTQGKERYLWLLFLIMFTSGVLNWMIIGSNYLALLLKYFFVFFPIAIFLATIKKPKGNIFYAVSVGIFCIVMGYWIKSEDGYQLFYKTSRNYVSVYLLVAIFVYSVFCVKHKKEIHLIVPVIFFLASVSAVGRGGIISSFCMMIFFFIYKVFDKKRTKTKKKFFKIMALCVAFICAVVYVSHYYEYIVSNYFWRFSSFDIVDTTKSNQIRFLIAVEYIHAIMHSALYFLLGCDPGSLSSLMIQKGGNLHNSFLQMHSIFGIIGPITIIYTTFCTFAINLKCKRADMIILYITLMIRGVTDLVFGGYIGDIIFLYYLSMSVLSNSNKKLN